MNSKSTVRETGVKAEMQWTVEACETAGASANVWSKIDRHMQHRPGLLKHMKKETPFSIPLHCLLSNSQYSVGYFIHWRARELTFTPKRSKQKLTSKPHLYVHTKAQKQTFGLATMDISWNGGGSICPGGMGARSKPKPFGLKVRKVVWVISTRPSHPAWPPFLTPVKSWS